MDRSDKPAHLAPEYAAQFRDGAVVAAYAARPPYPPELFAALKSLLPSDALALALELGCGTGDLTFGLAPHVAALHAIDPSPAMLRAAIARHTPVPGHVRLMLASAEAFRPRESFSLVVAAESLHWMDWSEVLPKIASWLTPDGVLAIVTARSFVGLPWAEPLRAWIAHYSTNRDYQPYDIVAELVQRGLFRELGRKRCSHVVSQTVDDYVESFHSRNGLSRERMSLAAATEFDAAVRALVLEHRPDGIVRDELMCSVVWGTPIAAER